MDKSRKILIPVCCILAIATVILILRFTKNNIFTKDTYNSTADTHSLNKEEENTSPYVISSEDDETDEDENILQTEPVTEPPAPVYSDITIAFTGDILLADKLNDAYNASGVTGFISQKIADTLSGADITFVNEEFPFSNRGTPEPNKEYTYCVPPERVKIFKDMGVDIVSISNNHILDYGQDALADTFPTLDEYGIDYVGGGANLDRAKQLITYEVNGKTIGFLAASRVVPNEQWYALNESETSGARAGVFTTYDSTALCEEIRKAKQICDFVIVYAHWGIERQEVAADYQRNLAYNYIDAGADLVIGSHAHVMQGMEFYKDVPIVYGMGNFLFSNYYSRTTVVTCTIKEDNSCDIEFLPCGSQSYYTYDLDESGIEEFYNFLNRVSFGVTFNSDGSFNYTNHQ